MNYKVKSNTLNDALSMYEDLSEIEELRISATKAILEKAGDTTFEQETTDILKAIPNVGKLVISYASENENDFLHIDINAGMTEVIEAIQLRGVDLSAIDLNEFFEKHKRLHSIRLENCNISNIDFLEFLPNTSVIDLSNNPIPAKYADNILDLVQRKFILIDLRGCTELFEEFEKKDFKLSKFLTDKKGKLDGNSFYEAYEKALFSREITVRDMQQLVKYIDFFSERLKQEKRAVYVDDIEEFDEQYIAAINQFGLGEHTTLVMTPEHAKRLAGRISPEINVQILIRNASELSVEQLEAFTQQYHLQSVRVDDPNQSLDYEQITPYDIATYKKCRATIDSLLEGIVLSENPNDDNRDKKLFGEVIKRLANHMSYDYEAIRREEEGEINWIVAKSEENVTSSQESPELVEAREQEELSRICRNMEGGLLNNTCVCAGYAEIARNVFSCCGIDARYMWGYNTIEQTGAAHAWNQIRLDGEWYNMDLTWDRDTIVAGKVPQYLLQSDKDFNTKKHPYYAEICKREKCDKTLSTIDLVKYVYGIDFRELEINPEETEIQEENETQYYVPVERGIKVAAESPEEQRRKRELLREMESDITESEITRSYDILMKTQAERKKETPSVEMEEIDNEH